MKLACLLLSLLLAAPLVAQQLPTLSDEDQAVVSQGAADWQRHHAPYLDELRRLSAEGQSDEDVEKFLKLRGELMRSVTAPIFSQLGMKTPDGTMSSADAFQLIGQLMKQLPADRKQGAPGLPGLPSAAPASGQGSWVLPAPRAPTAPDPGLRIWAPGQLSTPAPAEPALEITPAGP